MIQPSDSETPTGLAVRDGRGGPVTCAACGCRLAASGEAFFHFNPLGGRDARGCRVGLRRCRPRRRGSRRSPSRSEPDAGDRPSAAPDLHAAQAARSALDHDPIADAADRHDLRAAGRLDLGAKAREVRLEPEQVRIGLGRPAGARQLEVRDDVAGGPDQRLEQPELGRGQRQRRLADARLVAARARGPGRRPSAARRRSPPGPPPGRPGA